MSQGGYAEKESTCMWYHCSAATRGSRLSVLLLPLMVLVRSAVRMCGDLASLAKSHTD